MKTAIGYTRISKSEAKSVSLTYQESEIKKTAKANGYTLVGILTDDGISGKSMSNRPSFQNVLNMVNNRTVDAIIVFKSDRISRNGLENLMFESLLTQKRISYISCSEGILCDATEDPLLKYIRSGLNERERLIISLRTKTALQTKKEAGFALGQPKYGQSIINGQTVQNSSETSIVKRSNELHSLGFSTRQIADILNQEGFKTRRGSAFRQTQVVRILKNAA